MKKLIADAGSTKTSWATIVDGKMQRTITGNGINPQTMSDSEILNFLGTQIAPLLRDEQPEEIWYYGAGCKQQTLSRIENLLKKYIPTGQFYINTDMLGAARATLSNTPGVVCILGTGSNSCYYDGKQICENVSPLGYILGDEGSGTTLGKILVGEIFKGNLKHLQSEFFEEMGVNEAEIIERVYRKPLPNRFLASLTPFLYNHKTDINIHNLIVNEFIRFLDRNVKHYPMANESPIAFVGSIAWWFKDELSEALLNRNYQIGKIIQKPLEGLIEFHS